MVAKPDAGVIVAQSIIPILPDETAFEVFGKLSTVAEQTLWNTLPNLLKGEVTTLPNDIKNGSYFSGRKPEDGLIDWSKSAEDIYNLHRAVAPPYPGAWTMVNGKMFTIGKARRSHRVETSDLSGLAVRDGVIFGICGQGHCIRIHELLDEGGEVVSPQALKAILDTSSQRHLQNGNSSPTKTIFILGANGFVGHHVLKRILESTDWKVCGIDIDTNRIVSLLEDPVYTSRIIFKQGCMKANKEWIESRIMTSDVILPLAAITTPLSYVKAPLRVFELNFEANLEIVRLVAKHKKRLIFPSTSEVYGMCHDTEFDPEASQLIYGPVQKSRWIYSCAKQLLDRIIFGYGEQGLDFTIFRPFNWIGPGLDSLNNIEPGSSRVTTQFLGNIVRGQDIELVEGGLQRRAFTSIHDGVDALMKIIANKDGVARGKIYNIGNPCNNYSIREVATLMLETAATMKGFAGSVKYTKLRHVKATEFYGEGYQDVQQRVPKITNTCEDLGWRPSVPMEEIINSLFIDLASPS